MIKRGIVSTSRGQGLRRSRVAMDHEFDALIKNCTWHLVPPKQGANIIDCKWVYKVKSKAKGFK
jgi:hypothetical protein